MKNMHDPISTNFAENSADRIEDLYKLRDLAQENIYKLLSSSPLAPEEDIKSCIEELVKQEKLILDWEHLNEKKSLEQKISALEDKISTDTVTGGKNRNGFELAASNAIDDIRANPKQEYIVVFIDLDGFKNVNDQCGHEEGDYALMDAHNALDDMINPDIDTAARLGGDEMVLLLKAEQGRDLNAGTIRDRVRKNFQGMARWVNETPYPIGASIGIAVMNADALIHKNDAQISKEAYIAHTLKTADEAMYKDKAGKTDRLLSEYKNLIQAKDTEKELIGEYGINPSNS